MPNLEKSRKKTARLGSFGISFHGGTEEMNRDVLITDGHWRKTLAAVRGLGRNGVRVTVGESTRIATAMFSRYCSRRLAYPSVFFKPQRFLEFLEKELTSRPYRMLLPMEDETLELIASHRDVFSRLAYLPFVDTRRLRFARRKDKILRLAQDLGIPTPETWLITDLAQIETLKARLPYPVVIKPRTGSGAVGIRYPRDPDELVSQYRSAHARHPFPMIQEMVPRDGAGYGASFLFDEKGRVKASFVHKRLREYPVTGGASTLRESVRRDDVLEMGRALLEAIGWFGVAMVEFKLDPRDSTPKLMEVNPRFWGSLALAVGAGVNFPYLLYLMSLGIDFRPVEEYKIGQRCRWLLPGDLLHFVRNPNRGSLLPGFLSNRNTAHDIWSREDPLPVVGNLLTLLTLVYDRDMKHRLRERKMKDEGGENTKTNIDHSTSDTERRMGKPEGRDQPSRWPRPV
jgi:predicted ATP-grasp superfamily ATP-dependent carboligase